MGGHRVIMFEDFLSNYAKLQPYKKLSVIVIALELCVPGVFIFYFCCVWEACLRWLSVSLNFFLSNLL